MAWCILGWQVAAKACIFVHVVSVCFAMPCGKLLQSLLAGSATYMFPSHKGEGSSLLSLRGMASLRVKGISSFVVACADVDGRLADLLLIVRYRCNMNVCINDLDLRW